MITLLFFLSFSYLTVRSLLPNKFVKVSGIKLLISFFVVLLLQLSFQPHVIAQVNINTQETEGDTTFFELSDSDSSVVFIDEDSDFSSGVITPTPSGFVLVPATEVNSNVPAIRSLQEGFSGIEGAILDSDSVPQFIKDLISQVGLPTAAALAFTAAFLPAILTILPLLISPQLFYLLFNAIFGKKGSVWGIVKDKKTKKPIPFAVVRLFEQDSTAQIASKVSDLEGRYGFVLSEGKYRIEARQSGYEPYLKNIVIARDEELFAEDIILSRLPNNSPARVIENLISNLKAFTFRYGGILTVIGFLSSLLSFIVNISIFNGAMIILYTSMILLLLYIKYRENKTWGVVVDSVSGLKIAGATIRLFDPANSLADTQLSDSRGRFGFFVEPGEYTMLVVAAGYKYPSKHQQDFTPNKDNPNLLNVNVAKSEWLNMQILLDPTEGLKEQQQAGTASGSNSLSSPFA